MSVTDADVSFVGVVPEVDQSAASVTLARRAKRALDVTLALLALLVCLPVMVAVALLVRRDGGPALFSQARIGRGGRSFRMYKFRSMAVDAEDRLRSDPDLHARYVENDFKLPAEVDPRITPLGRFLRASSLDELPQLINVLRGEMSMVGPRPIVEGELREYRIRGGETAYLRARPGMTGMWQTSGRSLVGYDERVAMDREYVEQGGLKTDVSIMARTVLTVLRREGAH